MDPRHLEAVQPTTAGKQAVLMDQRFSTAVAGGGLLWLFETVWIIIFWIGWIILALWFLETVSLISLSRLWSQPKSVLRP